MKKEGINNNLTFIVNETSPILDIKKGMVEESDKKLMKGTVINGMLKTRIVKISGDKVPYRFIQLENKKGYISPQVVNLYVSNFANLDGLSSKSDNTPVRNTSFGQKNNRGKKTKNFIVNYGVPLVGAVVGYKIAKKMGVDSKKTIGYVLFFGLLGCIPRYIYRNK